MPSYSDRSDFMAGVYVIEFESEEHARLFVETYGSCPVWPLIAQLPDRRKVFVLARELKAQRHGEFAEESNTLAEHPEFIGARSVEFRRDDGLVGILGSPRLTTGEAAKPPCGSDCSTCPSYQNPCRGCPATRMFGL
ncbi:MAG: hypothetical protein JSW65_07640 [Candidatus Bipolaricaulota bacterium]|nr:MAG: hypothetical protein JSW65_07640 [Candidatus Bipolaricaulota bacterium]